MTHVASTTPYAWPFDDTIDPERTALVVAGGGPAWAAVTPDDPVAREQLDRLRAALPACGVLTIVVDHQMATDRITAVVTPAPSVTGRDGEPVVTAAGIDGFYGSALDATLHGRGRTHLLVAGYGLETAVHSTVRRANDRGYECLTVIDASVAHDPELRHASRSSIEMSGGIFGAVGATADVLAAFTT